MAPVRLVTLAPGHFHAALIQKEMHPSIDRRVHIYAPLDGDLSAHLNRVIAFNSRPVHPTCWQVELHAGDDWMERFLRDRPGNVVVLSGKNQLKIDLIRMAVEAGMHVLADKPLIIEQNDLPELAEVVALAEKNGLALCDMMTERHEITSILQRELMDDLELFGIVEEGDPKNPGVFIESVHYLKKLVAGSPLRRPAWFFDVSEQGEALADVGTHLVDLVMWMLFTHDPIVHTRDVQVVDARRWATSLDRRQFEAITGRVDFPQELQRWLKGNKLDCFCNNQVVYSMRGLHVRLDVLWDYEAPAGGGDTHNAVFRGTRCSVVVRQAGGKMPELYAVPNGPGVRDRLAKRIDSWQRAWPGIRLIPVGDEFQIFIPDIYRSGHESHFAEVTAEFLGRVEAPEQREEWENIHLLSKYFITTTGVALARKDLPEPRP
jgi:predicted dehydrogenase